MNTSIEFEPFGPEWAKEMAKMPKKDIIEKFKNSQIALKNTEEWLLKTTQNLGHPSYGHSSSTTIGIDNLRESAFDFLGVPKSVNEEGYQTTDKSEGGVN